MVFNLLVINGSLKVLGTCSISEIEKLIIGVNELVRFASINGDKIYQDDKLLYSRFFNGIRLYQILYENALSDLRQSVRTILLKSFDRIKTVDNLTKQIKTSRLVQSKDECNGLLTFFNSNHFINELQVKNIQDWYIFHRYCLGKFPLDEENFYLECTRYYPKVSFHQNIPVTLKKLEGGLDSFSQSITKALSQLNDEFHKYHNPTDRITSLRKFSSASGFETTPEGDLQKKKRLNFEFIDQSKNLVTVCCEPHIKLSNSDIDGDSHFYSNRIYFHEGRADIYSGRILVAHIGKHL